MTDLNAIHQTALEAALQAGDLLREQWLRPRQISHKGFRDLVTDADIAAQKRITNLIQARFPEHTFLTEEDDHTLPQATALSAPPAGSSRPAPVTWIIDPIDGTSNFSRQVPIFCVAIGVAIGGRVAVGVIHDPLRQETFSAVTGRGATCNTIPMHASPVHNLADAIFALDWSHTPPGRAAALNLTQQIAPRVHTLRAIGSAALALAWVAAGRLDAYLNLNLKPWDVSAASLLLHEAGATLSQTDGQPWIPNGQSLACLASTPALHSQLLAIINRLA